MHSGLFNNDYREIAGLLQQYGTKHRDHQFELVNMNITIKDPRNRVLLFRGLNQDVQDLIRTAMQTHYRYAVEECEFATDLLAFNDTVNTGNKDLIHFMIRDNQLHLVVTFIDQDFLNELPEKVFAYTSLMEMVYLELLKFNPTLELGHYFHNVNNVYVLEKDVEKLNEVINADAVDTHMIPMDSFNHEQRDAIRTLFAIDLDEALDQWDKEIEKLSDYWQLAVMAFITREEAAIHTILNIHE